MLLAVSLFNLSIVLNASASAGGKTNLKSGIQSLWSSNEDDDSHGGEGGVWSNQRILCYYETYDNGKVIEVAGHLTECYRGGSSQCRGTMCE